MKTSTVTAIISFFVIMAMTSASQAASSANRQMMLDESEPYGTSVATIKVSPQKIANLYMLQAELEPYGETIVKRSMRADSKNLDNMRMLISEMEPYGGAINRPDVRTADNKLTPRKYANLCMVCDEIK